MSVNTLHPDYKAMASRWRMCRDAASGEHAVHAAGELYLPKFDQETDKAYEKRLKMTPFFNATWRTIAGLSGMMFRKPPVAAIPEQLTDALDDIDLAGTTMQGMAQKIALDALTVGRAGLLVDYPAIDTSWLTQADVKRLKLRPMMSLYKAEAIINWRTSRANGANVLSMVVLEESAELPGKDEFETVIETRYRVLDLTGSGYRQRVFKVDERGDQVQLGPDTFPKMNNGPMPFIPFLIIGVDTMGVQVEAPPMIDLVTTNFKHYGQATSYERGCFFSGLPTLFISGLNEDKPIYIGGNMANVLPQPDSKAYFVEVVGEFNALRTNLEDKKREMAVLGARMLESQKAGVESAETIARRQNGEESLLSAMSQTISIGLTKALQWFAEWSGVQGVVSYQLNKDFIPATLSAQELTALVATWQSGAISANTLFENLKAGEIIAENVSFEDEQARIGESSINLQGQVAQP